MDYSELSIQKNTFRGLIKSGEKQVQDAIRIVNRHLKLYLTDDERKLIRNVIVRLRCSYRERWVKSARRVDRFDKANKIWLNSLVRMPTSLLPDQPILPKTGTGSEGITRKLLPFHEKCLRTKQKEIARVSDDQREDTELLLKATSRTLKQRGYPEIAYIILETLVHAGRAKEMKQILSTPPKIQIPFTPNEALALVKSIPLSKRKYEKLRMMTKNKGYGNQFPTYKLLRATTTNGSLPVSNSTLKVTEGETEPDSEVQLISTNSVSAENVEPHSWCSSSAMETDESQLPFQIVSTVSITQFPIPDTNNVGTTQNIKSISSVPSLLTLSNFPTVTATASTLVKNSQVSCTIAQQSKPEQYLPSSQPWTQNKPKILSRVSLKKWNPTNKRKTAFGSFYLTSITQSGGLSKPDYPAKPQKPLIPALQETEKEMQPNVSEPIFTVGQGRNETELEPIPTSTVTNIEALNGFPTYDSPKGKN